MNRDRSDNANFHTTSCTGMTKRKFLTLRKPADIQLSMIGANFVK